MEVCGISVATWIRRRNHCRDGHGICNLRMLPFPGQILCTQRLDYPLLRCRNGLVVSGSVGLGFRVRHRYSRKKTVRLQLRRDFSSHLMHPKFH